MPSQKTIEALRHEEDKRNNIPTVEFQAVLQDETKNPAASPGSARIGP